MLMFYLFISRRHQVVLESLNKEWMKLNKSGLLNEFFSHNRLGK